ncbi:MAG: hypothetical protein WCP85_00280 [Mariniphaga sp.]
MFIKDKTNAIRGRIICILILSMLCLECNQGNSNKIDKYDFLRVVSDYADTMIKYGRDHYGKEHSSLFASSLDRKSMTIGNKDNFDSIPGVRTKDRSIGGANPMTDIALYEILYHLSEIKNQKAYAQEADSAMKFFFTYCQNPVTGLMTWGEHIYWDFETDTIGYQKYEYHEAYKWPLWDKVYELVPEAGWKFAIGEWDHQISDKKTGDFSRHALWSKHGPEAGADFPRYAGQMISLWADAFMRTQNKHNERRNEMIQAIEVIFNRMNDNQKRNLTGYLPAFRDADYVWNDSNLELAINFTEAANQLYPSSLAEKLMLFSFIQDVNLINSPHRIQGGGGFALTLDAKTCLPITRAMNRPYTSDWDSGYGYVSHAFLANKCFERYKQLEFIKPEYAGKYRILIIAAADQYLYSTPSLDKALKPGTFSDVINLLINSYELTHDARYIERARFFGNMGIDLFLDNCNPLPKATNRNTQYESITGGPDFMLALLKLHILKQY